MKHDDNFYVEMCYMQKKLLLTYRYLANHKYIVVIEAHQQKTQVVHDLKKQKILFCKNVRKIQNNDSQFMKKLWKTYSRSVEDK